MRTILEYRRKGKLVRETRDDLADPVLCRRWLRGRSTRLLKKVYGAEIVGGRIEQDGRVVETWAYRRQSSRLVVLGCCGVHTKVSDFWPLKGYSLRSCPKCKMVAVVLRGASRFDQPAYLGSYDDKFTAAAFAEKHINRKDSEL